MQTHTEGEAHTHTGREKGEEREQSKTHPSGVVKANEGSVQGWHRQPFHVVKKRGGGGGGQAGWGAIRQNPNRKQVRQTGG